MPRAVSCAANALAASTVGVWLCLSPVTPSSTQRAEVGVASPRYVTGQAGFQAAPLNSDSS